MQMSRREGLADVRVRATQDFGGSLFLYVSMMIGGLALFVLPIYWLNAAEVHTNPGVFGGSTLVARGGW